MIDVRVTMLQQVDARLVGQSVGQRLCRLRRHDGERYGRAGVAMDRQQPLERGANIGRIVVAPPQIGRTAGLRPARRFV
jgi:hypothetical protein